MQSAIGDGIISPMLQDFDLKQLVIPLADWFTVYARELPWRSNPSPYYVWISEIMLQQTRVEAVKPYFQRFVTTLPDVAALAACPEDVYLKLWEGLGYYSRVRNLHTAALQIMEQYGGEIPADYEELLKLKGIGHYTAGAIASLAYGRPVPAVDGNVLRVLTRVSSDDTDIMKQSFRNQVEEQIKALLEEISPDLVTPRVFNQALMELGALVCVPNGEPHCGACPWKVFCMAHLQGRIQEFPVKAKAKERRKEKRTVFLLHMDDKIAIHKRSGRGLLAGLYELPNQEGHFSEDMVRRWLRERGYESVKISQMLPAKHIFSHVEWHMVGYDIFIEEMPLRSQQQIKLAQQEELLFVSVKEQQERYALPSAFAAYRPE